MNQKTKNPLLSLTSFSTAVYCKPTFTSLLTPFDFLILFTYKRSVIFSPINWCFNICSTHAIFNTELEKFKSIFIPNTYPENLVNCCIASFLDKIFLHSTKAISVPKCIIYFSLPFTGQHFLQIWTQIKKLSNSAFPHINLQLIACPSLCLFTLFCLKIRFNFS